LAVEADGGEIVTKSTITHDIAVDAHVHRQLAG
jgi:hypothetical protein